MKKLIAICLFTFSFCLVSPAQTAYLVTITPMKRAKTTAHICHTIAQADSLIDATLGANIPTEKLMKKGFFDIITPDYYVYCELKAVKANGKLSRRKLRL